MTLILVGGKNAAISIATPGFLIKPEKSTELLPKAPGLFLHIVEVLRSNPDETFSAISLLASDKVICGGVKPEFAIKFPDFRCSAQMQILRLRYEVARPISPSWKERFVFEPGSYVVRLDGNSQWATRAGADTKSGNWSNEVRFDVVYPEHLRPYVAYSTIGDTRIFGKREFGWDPSPYGVGLPIYQSERGALRFKVPYMASIFPTFSSTISPEQPVSHVNNITTTRSSVDLRVTPNPFGEDGLTDAGRKWRAAQNVSARSSSEVLIDPPWPKGISSLELSFESKLLGQKPGLRKLDEWTFEGSLFNSFVDHVAHPGGAIDDAFDATGSVAVPATPDVLSAHAATKGAEAGRPQQEWLLPYSLAAELVSIDSGASLRFLKVAERMGAKLNLNAQDQLEGFVGASPSTRITAILDRAKHAYTLWYRTQEPLDWRRVSASLLIRSFSKLDEGAIGFDVKIMPSPDGTSCFLFVVADGRAIRLPQGAYDISFEYALRKSGLPTRRRASDSSDLSPWMQHVRVAVPFGIVWPT